MNDVPFNGNGTDDWQPDARIHPDLLPVWDAVWANHPHVIAQINGPDQGVGLDKCVGAFHAEAVRLQCPVRLDLLLGMFACCPDGGFAYRVGTEASSLTRSLWMVVAVPLTCRGPGRPAGTADRSCAGGGGGRDRFAGAR
jgi:hypothetical protein